MKKIINPEKDMLGDIEDKIRQIKSFLLEKDKYKLASFINDISPEDIAEILGEFSPKDKIIIFDSLKSENAAVVLDDTDPQTRLQILQKIDNSRLAKILDEMPVDEAADIVEDVPEKDREDILDLMGQEDAEEVEEILSYPEDSAARVMTPEFIAVHEKSDVETAIRNIRKMQIEEDIFYAYVINDSNKLSGTVSVGKLLTVPTEVIIEEIMDKEVKSIFAGEDQEKAALIMKKYDLLSLPVVDKHNHIIGRITADDIIDVMDEERGEDISRMTGTIEEEQGAESHWKAIKNRLPWLVTCMLGSIVTGIVIRFYRITLAEVIALVSFIPVITATGGNSGVQASTVVVREIALGHMDYFKVGEEVYRQLKIALGLGTVCGIVLSFLAKFWLGDSVIGIIVGVSIFLVVVWSNFIGVITPVLFKRIHVDPAIASGPLITTLNDIVGVFIYLSIATYFLGSHQ